MKGIIPIIAVLLLFGALVVFGSGAFRPASIISCPAGQHPETRTDPSCGVKLEASSPSTAGICTRITCEKGLTTDTLKFCHIWTQNSPTKITMQPWESKTFPDACNAYILNGGKTDMIYFQPYFESAQFCDVCVLDNKPPPECASGQVRCNPSVTSNIQVCGFDFKWVASSLCNAGETCRQLADGNMQCVQTCAGDFQCPSTDFCSGGTCAKKRPDGIECSVNNQCASNKCEAQLFGGSICKTGSGTGGTTCDPGSIKTSEDCIQCSGTWKDPGLLGRGWTALFGGKTEPARCELPLVNPDIARIAGILIGAFFWALIIVGIIFVAGWLIPAVGLFSRNPMIMLALLGILTLLFFLAGAGK